MKHLLTVISLLALVACSGASDNNTSDTNQAIVKDLYAAFAAGDIPAVLDSLAADVVWSEAEGNPYADNSPYVGPDAVGFGLFARLGGEWIDFAAQPQEFLGEDDQVVVMGRYSGTYNATGESLNAQFAHVWTLQDGKVIAFQQYADTRQLHDVMTCDAAKGGSHQAAEIASELDK